MKVLVVDDEYFICQLNKEELEDEGYEVVVAHNGDEALAKVESEHPDIVTMDIKMRYDGEGVHALRQIKQVSYFRLRNDYSILFHSICNLIQSKSEHRIMRLKLISNLIQSLRTLL